MCLKNIESNLKSIAYKKSIPFCYSCYKEAPSGVCKNCHSDDLMRLMPQVGCEYGTEWIVEELIEQNLTPVDEEELFLDEEGEPIAEGESKESDKQVEGGETKQDEKGVDSE